MESIQSNSLAQHNAQGHSDPNVDRETSLINLLTDLTKLGVQGFDQIQQEISYIDEDIEQAQRRNKDYQHFDIRKQNIQLIWDQYKHLTNNSMDSQDLQQELEKGLRDLNLSLDNLPQQIIYIKEDIDTAQKRQKYHEISQLTEQLNKLENLVELNRKIQQAREENGNKDANNKLQYLMKEQNVQSIDQLEQEILYTKENIQKYQKRNQKDKELECLNKLQDLNEILSLQSQLHKNFLQQSPKQQLFKADNPIQEIVKKQVIEERKVQAQVNPEINENQEMKILSVSDKNSQDKENFIHMFNELPTMPDCFEKSLKFLLSAAGKLNYGQLSENDPIQIQLDELQQKIRIELTHFKEYLKQEELYGIYTQKLLQEAESYVHGYQWEQFQIIMKQLYRQLIIVDINQLKRLSNSVNEAQLYLSGKSIILILGGTGAGKSTTIHYLAGSKMAYMKCGDFESHIGPLEIKNKDLLKVKTSPFCQSETKYISPVTIQFSQIPGCEDKSGTVILCDSPGFEDNRGPEQDIINGLGIIQAIQGCESIVPVVLTSIKSEGTRGEGIKKLADTIIRMSGDKIDVVLDKLIFLFTNYTQTQQKDILATVTDLKTRTPENEQSSIKFFEKMIRKIKNGLIMIDPINDQMPGLLLEKLAESSAVFNPRKNFKQFLSEKSRSALQEQIRLHQQSVQAALKSHNYILVEYKLDQLYFLKELVQQEFVDSLYQEIINVLVNYTNNSSNRIVTEFNKCIQSNNSLELEDVQLYSQGLQIAKDFESIRQKFLQNEGVTYENMLQNVQTQVKLLMIQSDENEIFEPIQKQILDKLLLIANDQTINQQSSYYNLKQTFSIRINALTANFATDLVNNDFRQCSNVLDQLSYILKQLFQHINFNYINIKYESLIKELKTYIIEQEENCSYIFVKQTIDENSSVQLKKSFDILTQVKGNQQFSFYNHIQKQDIDYTLKNLETRVIQLFNAFINDVRQLKNGEEKFKNIKQIGIYMNQIKQIQNIPAISHLTSFTYLDFLSEICNYIFQLQMDIEIEIRRLPLQNSIENPLALTNVNFDKIEQCLIGLENAKWIESFEREDFYEETFKNAKQLILGYISQITNEFSFLKCDLDTPNQVCEATQYYYIIEQTKVLSDRMEELKQIINATGSEYRNKIDTTLTNIDNIYSSEKKEQKFQQISLKHIQKTYKYLTQCSKTKHYHIQATTKLQNIKDFMKEYLEFLVQAFETNFNTLIECCDKSIIQRDYLDMNFRKAFKDILAIEQLYQDYFGLQNSINNELDSLVSKTRVSIKQQPDELDSKLRFLHSSQNYQQFLECLNVTRILSQLDEFIDSSFFQIYKNNKELLCQNNETQEKSFSKIDQFKYVEVAEQLNNLQSQQQNASLKQQYNNMNNYLQNNIENLLRETRSNTISLSMKQNFTREQIIAIVNSLNSLRQANLYVKAFIPTIDLEQQINDIQAIINKNFLVYLGKVETMIEQIKFKDAEEEIQRLSVIQQELGQYRKEELIEKFNSLEQQKQQKLTAKIQFYKDLPIDSYNNYPPKEILDRLESLHEGEYADHIIRLKEFIKANLLKCLESIQKSKSRSDINRKVNMIKNIFPYLNNSLQTDFNQQIVDFEQRLEYAEEIRREELERVLNKEDLEEIDETLKQYQQDPRNNREYIQKIKDVVLSKSRTLYQNIKDNLKLNSYEEIFQSQTLLYVYKKKFSEEHKEIASYYLEIQNTLQKSFKQDVQEFKKFFSTAAKKQIVEAKYKAEVYFDSDNDSQISYMPGKNDGPFNSPSKNETPYEFLQLIKSIQEFQNNYVSRDEQGPSLPTMKRSQSIQGSSKYLKDINIIQELFPAYDTSLQEINDLIIKNLREYNQRFNECIEKLNSVPLYTIISKLKKLDAFFEYINSDNDLVDLSFFKNLMQNISNLQNYKESLSKLTSFVIQLKEYLLQQELLSENVQQQKKERETFYQEIKQKIQFLQNMKELYVHAILEQEQVFDTCLNDLQQKIQKLIDQTRSLIKAQCKAQSEYKQLNVCITNISSIIEVLDSYTTNVKQEWIELKDSVLEDVRDRVQKLNLIDDFEDMSKILTEVKEMSRNLPVFSTTIDELLEESIQSIKKRFQAQGIGKIGVFLNKSDIGKQILQEHQSFQGYQRFLYNQRVKAYDIDQVLNKLGNSTKIDKKFLKEKYLAFIQLYDNLVQTHLTNSMSFIRFFNEFKSFKQQLVKKPFTNKKEKTFLKIVGDAVVTFFSPRIEEKKSNKKEGNQAGEDIRIKTILEWDDQNATKAINLIAYLFAYWTLKNSGDYFDASGQSEQGLYLFRPHPAQIISIFRVLGLGTFETQIVNHLAEIKTGEGKSITLAIVASTLAILKCQVYVACYSQYLTERDYKQFIDFFTDLEISKYINYGTFNQLAEQIINEKGQIRVIVKDIITNELNQLAYKKEKTRQKILLIDEVDVFFSKDLFGNTYCAQSNISDSTITTLLDYAWQTRADEISYQQHIQSQEYKDCLNNPKFLGYEFIIEAAFKDILNDLNQFKSHDYEVKDNKIGYKEQDNIVFNSVYGYQTLFAYYHEIESGRITLDENFKLFQCVGVNCGQFSYAEILQEFEIILGVTGTLQNLSQMEQDIIKQYYNINFFTFVPSVYGDSRLQGIDQRQDIKIVNKDDYFIFIEEEIKNRMRTQTQNVKRAVLVFFESKKELLDFYENSSIQHEYDNLQILYEGASDQEKKDKITHASCQGYVTLLTRQYGRGTDFISRDDTVNANGGVHVLQTFLSEEQSEETQIKGRTARQGQLGSYSMVLLDSSLEKFGIDLNIIKDQPSQQYDYLKTQRNKFFEEQYINNIEFVNQAKIDHIQSTQFLVNIFGKKIDEAKRFLKLKNQGKLVSPNKVKTLVLMDATGSMSNLLQKAKNTVGVMFQRANEILREAQLQEGCFQMQFAVYRNYSSHDAILQYSPWESQSDNIHSFMKTISVQGGQGNEAIEIGFFHANLEHQLDEIQQIILIGDAPANSKDEVQAKREGYNWSETKFASATYWQDELDKIKVNGIPVHAFYVHNRAKSNFENIAQQTKGKCKLLDIKSNAGADMLTDLVTTEVLQKAGDLSGKGQVCVELYVKKYGKSYI